MRERWMVGGAIVVTGVLVFAGMYVLDTPVNFPVVMGVQGRYFTPLIYPIGLVVEGGLQQIKVKKKKEKWWKKAVVIGWWVVVAAGTVGSVWDRYYRG
jgi:uncharacterized membrane protein